MYTYHGCSEPAVLDVRTVTVSGEHKPCVRSAPHASRLLNVFARTGEADIFAQVVPVEDRLSGCWTWQRDVELKADVGVNKPELPVEPVGVCAGGIRGELH